MEMNTGAISSRYAAALLKFARETGNEEKVYRQVSVLNRSMSLLPQLRYLIDNPMNISDERKFGLLASALGEEKMAEDDDGVDWERRERNRKICVYKGSSIMGYILIGVC